METKELIEKAIRFHGHICSGLAIGVLAVKYVLEHGFSYSPNEEVVAVVENDDCSVDSLQILLGTTYGKGNLIHQDYGKLNYYFYNRDTKKGIKMSAKIRAPEDKKLSKHERIQKLLNSKPEDFFNIYEIEYNPPGLAQIEDSITCEICGEKTAISRIMSYKNSDMCIPCYKAQRKL
ncbi:MAG: FmdE family protein [Promethearchaeota archaeon]|jgi:formylmethanofuran dehydrogenase subunit E